jgi:DNA-directed RNA polymerase subunit RPC12/RpoP
MCPQTTSSFDQCIECGKDFKHIQISDPRKGYDVLQEDADQWKIQCKGCDAKLVIPR